MVWYVRGVAKLVPWVDNGDCVGVTSHSGEKSGNTCGASDARHVYKGVQCGTL